MSKRTKSLRGRLTSLVIVAIFGAVAIATLSSVWRETAQFSAGKRTELYASANVFASAVSGPVSDGDKAGALNALRAISFIPTIDYVRIETTDGALFAELGGERTVARSEWAGFFTENSPLSMLLSQSAVARVPVVSGGEEIATLTLRADTGSLSARIGLLVYDALAAAIFAGGIGVLIALKMQRAITDPIMSLVKVMSRVRESGDFSARAEQVEADETGQLVETFNTMLDHIQERDSKLLAHQRDLKKIVDQRTKQLRIAKESAEAANVAKSDFLATMSHEIRTPMNGMLAMADLLSKAPLAPRHKRYAEVIAKSGQSLLAIINDILDFSKIEAGRLDLEKIPVRPADIIDDVVSLFWERAASKHIDLAAFVSANTPEEIEGDPVRISQVLSNLVNNALKFTEKGHVLVTVDFKAGARGRGPMLEFSVADTGVGIAEDKQAAIFEAFSQADQTTTRRYGGTGLGLAISRRLVEAMEGDIGLVSKPGKGSRFFFTMKTRKLAPPRAIRRVKDEKRAIIAIDGDATPKMLAHYLRECGVMATIVEQDADFGPLIACADMIFASPTFYHAYQKSIEKGRAQWIPARVCICEFGDTAPDTLVETSVVEDILLAPLSRREVMDQIERILDGRLRGKAALAGAEPPAPSYPAFRGQRVLAADDSAVNREVVKEALARLNLKATLAHDGREAVRLAQAETFDLILMDCSMPEMDGYEATHAIRALEKLGKIKPVPIVALSAHVAGKEDQWRSAGMNDYLTKPFTLEVLAAVLGKHLDTGGATDDAYDAQTRAAPATAGDGAVFDRTVMVHIAAIQGGGGDLPLRTLSLFEEHSRNAMRGLIDALKAGDGAAVARAAHALKSMSANVGATRLAAACGALEHQAADGAGRAALSQLGKTAAEEFRAAHKKLPDMMTEFKKSAA
jgi:two-component system sensor histidine kinase BarA